MRGCTAKSRRTSIVGYGVAGGTGSTAARWGAGAVRPEVTREMNRCTCRSRGWNTTT